MIVLAILLAATVTGRVVGCDGSALPGATVTVSTGQKLVTDADGRFALDVPDDGKILVSAKLDGFVAAEETVCRTAPLEIALMSHVIDSCIPIGNATLPDSRRIGGQVTDLDGSPLRGASVRVGDRVTWTDERGQFQTELIPVGAYRLEIAASGYESRSVPVWVSSCNVPCDDRLRLRLAKSCQ